MVHGVNRPLSSFAFKPMEVTKVHIENYVTSMITWVYFMTTIPHVLDESIEKVDGL